MACSKLEAAAIYLVKQACGNDKRACVYLVRWRNLLDFLSHLTVVFPMFNQCIRFGEGGVRPTHSIQAIARTKSLS